MDPAKDANLIVMGGDDVRFMALKGKAIQATLMNPTTSFMAQKESFHRLASAGEYVKFIQGGIATTDDKIRQNPAKMARFMRGAMKGLHFYLTKRDAAIAYMMDITKMKDRELAGVIYDRDLKFLLKDAASSDQVLQAMIEDMRKNIGVKKALKLADVFDLTFVRKANEDLQASGWKP
jgi:ABC-type nitrate/sulfonate/bicarbonate transport system substrate-binding protein